MENIEIIQKLDLKEPGLFIARTNKELSISEQKDIHAGFKKLLDKHCKGSVALVVGPSFSALSKITKEELKEIVESWEIERIDNLGKTGPL